MKSDVKDDGLNDIKVKLSEIHADLRKYIELTNLNNIDMAMESSKRATMGPLVGHLKETAAERLDRNMVKKCEMREECKAKFTGLLDQNAGMLYMPKVTRNMLSASQDTLTVVKKTAPYKQCERCLTEASGLLGEQVRLIQSMSIYDDETVKATEISKLPVEVIVDEMLEPVSNKARLMILKALTSESRSFSSLSEKTGLRGGNLLFHIQKLLDGGLILQRHDRGDYMITKKGFILIKQIGDAYQIIHDMENEN